MGSSPHTWRTPTPQIKLISSFRIISTYVENTDGPVVIDALEEDHLHIRGEHLVCASHAVTKIGSSPHTWRTQGDRLAKAEKMRIISTYVENTRAVNCSVVPVRDHLHIRGEHTKR